MFLRPSAKTCVFCWWDGIIASADPSMIYSSNHSTAKLTLNMRFNFRQPKHRRVCVRSPPSWMWIRDDKLTLVKSVCAKMFGELLSDIMVFDSQHIYLDIWMEQGFSRSQMIIEVASEVSNLAWSLTITKWRRHFRANKVITDVRDSCISLTMVYFNCFERWK